MKEFWDLFSAGRSTITLTCTSCGNIHSTTDDKFDALLLCFPASHHEADEDCTLEQLIAHYNATELIPNCDCNICNQKTTLSKQIAITTCPPILCVVLCRKKLDGGSITSSVQFPVSGLNITGHELQYDLVGTIHHTPKKILILAITHQFAKLNIRANGSSMMMTGFLYQGFSTLTRTTKS